MYKLLALYDAERTIPLLHYYHHDSDYDARLLYSLGKSWRSRGLPCSKSQSVADSEPMFEAFAQGLAN
jgi:hypothetical protein